MEKGVPKKLLCMTKGVEGGVRWTAKSYVYEKEGTVWTTINLHDINKENTLKHASDLHCITLY